MWYSFGRFFVESIRLDPSDVFFGLRSNQISALVVVLVGLTLFMIQRTRHTGIETTGYLPGRFNKQLASDSEIDHENDKNGVVQGTEVGLTQSTEKK
jgi:hypothetical protein